MFLHSEKMEKSILQCIPTLKTKNNNNNDLFISFLRTNNKKFQFLNNHLPIIILIKLSILRISMTKTERRDFKRMKRHPTSCQPLKPGKSFKNSIS